MTSNQLSSKFDGPNGYCNRFQSKDITYITIDTVTGCKIVFKRTISEKFKCLNCNSTFNDDINSLFFHLPCEHDEDSNSFLNYKKSKADESKNYDPKTVKMPLSENKAPKESEFFNFLLTPLNHDFPDSDLNNSGNSNGN